jgi:hypothetical protein
MFANQRFELVHERRAGAERKLCFDPQLERAEAQLLQPCTLPLQEAPAGGSRPPA